MLGRLLFAAACIATFIVLLVIEENWRGKRDWQAYVREHEARGEHLDMAPLIPPPVPDGQNFAMTPLLAPIFQEDENSPGWGRYKTDLEKKLKLSQVEGKTTPHLGERMSGRYIDLDAWRDYLGMDALEWLKRFDPELLEISEASRRPYSRFALDYKQGVGTNLWHITTLMELAKLYTLRASAELHEGRTDAALADIQTIFRLCESVKNEPYLISRAAQGVMIQNGLQVVWEGLDEHRWTEAQLQALQGNLAGLDFLKELALSFRGERASLNEAILDALAKPEILVGLVSDGNGLNKTLRFIPSGVIYQNLLELNRFYEKYPLASVNPGARRIDPNILNEGGQTLIDTSSSLHFHETLERITMPVFVSIVSKVAYEQTSVDQAVIACALERYQLANHEYPETLAKLVPPWLKVVPLDVINGLQPHYRLNNDGTYLLYSDGWNGKDNHGEQVMNPDNTGVNLMKSDWVWSTRPPPETPPVKF